MVPKIEGPFLVTWEEGKNKSIILWKSCHLRHVTVLVYSSQKKSPFSVVSEKSTNKTWKRKQVVDNVFKEPLYNNHIGSNSDNQKLS